MTMRLILLPGLDGTGLLFRPLLEALGEGVTATAVAYPADRPLGYAELLPRVLAVLPKDEPFVLLGESFSGPLAVLVAATISAGDAPSGLRGLVLCATFLRNPHPYVPQVCARAVPAVAFRLFPFFAQAKALLGGYASGSLLGLLREAHGSVAPEVLAHRLREVFQVDVREELKAVRVPVLYIRGTRDLVVPSWNAWETRKVQAQAVVEDIPAPHLVLQTQPRLASEAIGRFLSLVNP